MNNIVKYAQAKNISISEVARRVGMHGHTLRRYTRGECEVKKDLAIKLAEVFGCMPSEILGLEPANPDQTIGKIPLYGAASAGPWNGAAAMSRAIDHIGRPSFLMSQDNAYGVFVIGTSMEPRFRAGEILFVDPDAPVRQGCDVVVQLNTDGELTAIAKQFKSMDDTQLRLHQLNPDEDLTISRDQVVAVHPVQGTWMRM